MAAATRIIHLIKNLSVYQNASCIAFYDAINGEINLRELVLDAQQQQKKCYMPRMNANQTLSFLPISSDTPSQRNQFNINEPLGPDDLALSPEHFDLIILPVVAFDQHGTRLGHGHGYYDRTLAEHQPRCIMGVAYAFQQQDFIPRQAWDVPLHVIMTENGEQWWG